jgi:uncharacterized membrane protein YgcG
MGHPGQGAHEPQGLPHQSQLCLQPLLLFARDMSRPCCDACLAAVRAQLRWMALVGLVFVASAVARADSTFELSQLSQTLVFLVVGAASNYLAPAWKRYQAVSAGGGGGGAHVGVEPSPGDRGGGTASGGPSPFI